MMLLKALGLGLFEMFKIAVGAVMLLFVLGLVSYFWYVTIPLFFITLATAEQYEKLENSERWKRRGQ